MSRVFCARCGAELRAADPRSATVVEPAPAVPKRKWWTRKSKVKIEPIDPIASRLYAPSAANELDLADAAPAAPDAPAGMADADSDAAGTTQDGAAPAGTAASAAPAESGGADPAAAAKAASEQVASAKKLAETDPTKLATQEATKKANALQKDAMGAATKATEGLQTKATGFLKRHRFAAGVVAVIAALVVLIGPARKQVGSTLTSAWRNLQILLSPETGLIEPADVSASSTLIGRNARTLLAPSKATYWADGGQDGGIGSSLNFVFSKTVRIDRIGVASGIQNGDAPWADNPRPKQLKITGGGLTQTITLSDRAQLQLHTLKPFDANSVQVQIESVYPGNENGKNWAAVTAMGFYGDTPS